MSEFIIRDANPNDIPVIKTICDDEFGNGYFNSFSEYLFVNHSILRVATQQNTIAGFYFSYADQENDSKTGIIKTLAIHKHFRQKGLGTNIFGDACIQLKQLKVQTIKTIIWKHNDDQAIKNILDQLDFKLEYEIADYWKEESILKGYDCPVCGNPCKCSASIYSKSI
ncbi:GNAT family N-acetyltransferase [Carboxylicivirga caseinilyticus]|uniref:GNAT family N-acetyltransferase n=1 Tax=Carboxylicivirga caseinilyticus TaxID=3417572 RepID=UPI003D32B27D|nr:GNAT family N-acetyltransferase [Marinilabiliaceae bacterium A049]